VRPHLPVKAGWIALDQNVGPGRVARSTPIGGQRFGPVESACIARRSCAGLYSHSYRVPGRIPGHRWIPPEGSCSAGDFRTIAAIPVCGAKVDKAGRTISLPPSLPPCPSSLGNGNECPTPRMERFCWLLDRLGEWTLKSCRRLHREVKHPGPLRGRIHRSGRRSPRRPGAARVRHGRQNWSSPTTSPSRGGTGVDSVSRNGATRDNQL
jgi:hypothetical protein